MIKAFKKWLAKAAYEGLAQPRPEIHTAAQSRLQMLLESKPACLIWEIDNGFLVLAPEGRETHQYRSPGVRFCADHQAIADFIVSSAMKQKLGVQSDMFEKEKQAAIAKSALPTGLYGTVTSRP